MPVLALAPQPHRLLLARPVLVYFHVVRDVPTPEDGHDLVSDPVPLARIVVHALRECNLDRRRELGPVERPDPELRVGLHLLQLVQLGDDLLQHLLVVAAVQQDDDRVPGDADGGVDGHDREQVGAEGVGQLPVGPLVGAGETVNHHGRNDHPDGEDDVADDVDVRGLDVDVGEEPAPGLLLLAELGMRVGRAECNVLADFLGEGIDA